MCTRFHKYHGFNIILYENNTVAHRRRGYSNALTFSEKPLKPGEIFLVEIELTEPGWTGDLRIGLTQLNPSKAQSAGLRLPRYALPDLNDMKSSWIFAIPKPRKRRKRSGLMRGGRTGLHRSMFFSPLQRYRSELNLKVHPTDVGSRIGIVYFPVPRVGERDTAELHFIINGEDEGAFARGIPFTEGPLYVVIDVYGCTKRVRIIQVKVPSLQSICREAILNHIKGSAVAKLPLPNLLKEYLLE